MKEAKDDSKDFSLLSKENYCNMRDGYGSLAIKNIWKKLEKIEDMLIKRSSSAEKMKAFDLKRDYDQQLKELYSPIANLVFIFLSIFLSMVLESSPNKYFLLVCVLMIFLIIQIYLNWNRFFDMKEKKISIDGIKKEFWELIEREDRLKESEQVKMIDEISDSG